MVWCPNCRKTHNKRKLYYRGGLDMFQCHTCKSLYHYLITSRAQATMLIKRNYCKRSRVQNHNHKTAKYKMKLPSQNADGTAERKL